MQVWGGCYRDRSCYSGSALRSHVRALPEQDNDAGCGYFEWVDEASRAFPRHGSTGQGAPSALGARVSPFGGGRGGAILFVEVEKMLR